MVLISLMESYFIYKILRFRDIFIGYYEVLIMAISIFFINIFYTFYSSYRCNFYGMNYSTSILFFIPIIIIISFVDIKYRLVFDIDVFCGIIISVIILLVFGNKKDIWISSISGGLLLFFISLMMNIATKQLGMGDVFYYGLCGTIVGVEHSIVLFFLSFFVAFIYVVIIKISNKKILNGLISFTPFISVSLLITILI